VSCSFISHFILFGPDIFHNTFLPSNKSVRHKNRKALLPCFTLTLVKIIITLMTQVCHIHTARWSTSTSLTPSSSAVGPVLAEKRASSYTGAPGNAAPRSAKNAACYLLLSPPPSQKLSADNSPCKQLCASLKIWTLASTIRPCVVPSTLTSYARTTGFKSRLAWRFPQSLHANANIVP